jgi:hypothetical protein
MHSSEELIEVHVRAFFEGHSATVHNWRSRQMDLHNASFRVLEMGPGPRTEAWTYVSVGAGCTEPKDGRRLEFVLCAREPSERFVELVTMVAYYHLSGETLDVGHTFSIGQPWLRGSTLDCVLVSLPYPFGPELEVFDRGEHHARILWLTPITSAERAFGKRAGAEALETRLEEAGIDILDPMRAGVVGEN